MSWRLRALLSPDWWLKYATAQALAATLAPKGKEDKKLRSLAMQPKPLPGYEYLAEEADDERGGDAETLGSPILAGHIGNGPGVGYSGAGTQRNFGQSGPSV